MDFINDPKVISIIMIVFTTIAVLFPTILITALVLHGRKNKVKVAKEDTPAKTSVFNLGAKPKKSNKSLIVKGNKDVTKESQVKSVFGNQPEGGFSLPSSGNSVTAPAFENSAPATPFTPATQITPELPSEPAIPKETSVPEQPPVIVPFNRPLPPPPHLR